MTGNWFGHRNGAHARCRSDLDVTPPCVDFNLVSGPALRIEGQSPMSRLFPVCLLAVCAVTIATAGPTEEAILAAMRLSEQPSYSWIATVADDARTYDISGRTIRGGYTRVRMPVINSVRRRLSRSVTDTQIELIFRGNVECVIRTEEGWMKPDDLPPASEPNPELDHLLGPIGTPGVPVNRSIVGGLAKGAAIRPSSPPAGDTDDSRRGYSNLQLGLSHPHEELGIIVSSHLEMKVEGELVQGTLTDAGAQLLLVRDGQKEITPLVAAGKFKLWLRNGMVARYQVRLEGVLQVDNSRGRRQILVNQTTDTVLKDVGTTSFDVPDEASRKLAR